MTLPLLPEPNLHAKLIRRMVMGKLRHPSGTVTRTLPEGGHIELIATHLVRERRAAKAWFIVGVQPLE